MAHVDDSGAAEPDRITIAAIVHAAGQGLLTTVEAGLLINRLHAHATRSPSSIQDSHPAVGYERTGNLSQINPTGQFDDRVFSPPQPDRDPRAMVLPAPGFSLFAKGFWPAQMG